jgi:ABC-2 type transport system ATP-binding protein
MSTGPRPNAPARADAIVVDGARKRFGKVLAVEKISLTVPAGTILGLIGPSGAGKTTTVRMLTGALRPDGGTVRVLGEEPQRFRRQTRAKIGYMPQQFTLYPDLTAAENVDFMASMFGLLWLRRRRRVREALQTVDLWEARGRRASALSGGMQRRLELACALVHEPTIYFLDEPTAGVDPLLRGRVWDELHRLKETGRTLLVTTQYVNEAEECDSVALIAHGRLLALATPDNLRREAMGGDMIEVETTEPFDGAVLEQLPEVRAVRKQGPRTFQVVVDAAGVATPAVMEAITEAGGDVAASREFRPSFDDVFAELVERDARQREEAGAKAEVEG